jgi:hypothetical protein
MPDTTLGASGPPAGPGVLPSRDQVRFLVGIAARAPSVHNTQPWRFQAGPAGLELHADRTRQLRAVDPAGRELLISCGAALFGLRLAARKLGYLPVVELLPDTRQPDLLARVRLGRKVPLGVGEWAMLAAVPHRHTHRGPFSPEPIPDGLLPRLQHDAIAEGATLVLLDEAARARMRRLAAVAARWQYRDAAVRDELTQWTRPAGSTARDGVPAHAYPARPAGPDAPADPVAGKLAERDFDLGRGAGRLETGGPPPAASAVLITTTDTPTDWLRAGQALNRMLIDAAGQWVFAALNSQPMESVPVRTLVRARLLLPGAPQMLLEFGRAHTASATARRPVDELLG